jgi:hypothetical protein
MEYFAATTIRQAQFSILRNCLVLPVRFRALGYRLASCEKFGISDLGLSVLVIYRIKTNVYLQVKNSLYT